MENLHPGPVDNSVLYDQERHISERVWNGKEAGPLRCIPTPNHDSWEINDRMWDLIRQTGLEQLAKIGKIELDHGLITGLVERWRPETNTFHLNCGEATVTLEDVAYIYGLPIDGLLVSGRTFSEPLIMVKVCEELLGMVPDANFDCYGVQIKFTWCRDNFGKLPKSRPRDQDVRRTRAFLFCLVAGQIFWTSSGTKAPAHILELFRHFEKRAWGPACLANLYRGLAKVWAYSRMAIGRPIRRRGDWTNDLEFPLLLTWHNRLRSHHFQTRVEEARRQLDIMEVDAFNWLPYQDYENISDYIDDGDVPLFRSNTALICFWVVERHCPERVMKQFGLQQIVPPRFIRPFPRMEIIPTGEQKREKLRSVYFGVWNRRMDDITYGEEGDAGPHSDAYFIWYRNITRLRIGRPTSGHNNIDMISFSSQVFNFTERLLASCDSAEELEGRAGDLERFIHDVRAEVVHFKDAHMPDFNASNLADAEVAGKDDASLKMDKGAQSGECPSKESKKRTRKHKGVKFPIGPIKSDIPSSLKPLRRSSRLMVKSIQPPAVSNKILQETPKETKRATSPISLSPRRSPRLVQTGKSPMSPIKLRIPNSAKSYNIPFISSPYTAQGSVATPSPGLCKIGIGRSPFSEISSMIMNVKARYREPKPPPVDG
ncbi:protein MAIN-LIKE 2 [Cinnamomum micranthum f. kanehirae]|uniref:Protein MAIN-LIKE 2 n=1 Tax=Cinnamomum micranthum f. kanehirae TaxID=337451 RepID=A0A3S3MG47_9MAGN|nr:protein MAIN-LIKE 2 [Cinnamomum micranthum f. kanehirae]